MSNSITSLQITIQILCKYQHIDCIYIIYVSGIGDEKCTIQSLRCRYSDKFAKNFAQKRVRDICEVLLCRLNNAR